MNKSEEVAAYYEKTHPFKDVINILRQLVLTTQVEETFKQSFPTYTLGNKNVQEVKITAMRHWKFKSEEAIETENVLLYNNETIELLKSGVTCTQKPKAKIKT